MTILALTVALAFWGLREDKPNSTFWAMAMAKVKKCDDAQLKSGSKVKNFLERIILKIFKEMTFWFSQLSA